MANHIIVGENGIRSKICTKCGLLLEEGAFAKAPSRPGGLRAYCRKCDYSINKERAQNKLEERKNISDINESTQIKFCPACSQDLPTSEFYKSNSRSSGLNSYCKKCDIAKKKERTLKVVAINEQKTEPTITEKKCGRCKETFPVAQFWADKRVKDGFRYCCKKCFRDSTANDRKRFLARSIERVNSGEVTHKKCPDCKELLPLSAYSKSIRMTYGVDSKCKECKSIDQKKRYKNLNDIEGPIRGRKNILDLKIEVFSHYSQGKPMCECCGNTFLEFLSIDHINQNGAQKRREEKHGNGYKLWAQIKAWNYPDTFKVLCLNCNKAAYWNNGRCPCQDK